MKKPGIHQRLLIAAFLLIFATTLTLDVVSVRITREFMHKRFQDRVTFLAKYLALNSEVGVLIGDKAGLKSLALNLLGEEDVARVTILDNHNNALVDLSRKTAGKLSDVEVPVVFKKSRDENLLFRSDRSTPFGTLKVPGKDAIGKVRIHYSTRGIDELMTAITHKFIWLSIGLAICAILVFFFLSRSIVVDVTRLADTARQVAEGKQELRAQPGNLPETRDLALAFNTMVDSLVNSQRALDQANQEMIRQRFLAEMGKISLIVAHEVKNPLSIIKSSLDVLKKDLSISSEEKMVSYIEDEIRRLNHLIEDFLMFARPVKPILRQVDLNDMLKKTLSRFQVQYMDSSINIVTEIPATSCTVDADMDLLSRAIGNIIKNAHEANGGNGTVLIRSQNFDDKWIVEVCDQGDGIVPENLKKIFEPFFTTRSKGSGLGLAFTAQVIASHGGTISARNREHGGAVFRVELPIG